RSRSGRAAEAESVESIIPQGRVGEELEDVDAPCPQQIGREESRKAHITAQGTEQHTRARIAVTEGPPIESRGCHRDDAGIGDITVLIGVPSSGPIVSAGTNHHFPPPVAPERKRVRQADLFYQADPTLRRADMAPTVILPPNLVGTEGIHVHQPL